MSAILPKADITGRQVDVRLVPKADIGQCRVDIRFTYKKQTSLPEFQLRHNLCHNPPRLIFAEQTARKRRADIPFLICIKLTEPNAMLYCS
jgi:hypothetical protein